MESIFKKYLQRLVNLSGNNRSLLLLNPYKSQFIDFKSLDFLIQQPADKILEEVVLKKSKIKICEVIDPRFEKSNEVSSQLSQILRSAKIIEEESGSLNLFVGYPFVEGKFMDGTLLRCPLMFFPVALSKTLNDWELHSRPDEIQFNYSFLTAYQHFNNHRLNEEFTDFGFNDFATDFLSFKTNLYELMKSSGIQINFNSGIFTDPLRAFEKLEKKDFEKNQNIGEMKLQAQAVLGIFPQGGSYLIADYERLMAHATPNFEDIFAPSAEVVSKIKEEDLLLPFQVDASQEAAIIEIKKGNSLKVEGPPGTGKSQLISNLLCDYIARGKKVLVVCQKRAALDTVYKRLNEIGISDFVGLVHDFKSDRKEIFQKILHQIEQAENYKKENQSLDVVFLEREFLRASRQIELLSRELEDFKNLLFDTSICQKSVKELYLLRKPNAETVDLSAIFTQFKMEEISDFQSKLKRLYAYKKHLNPESPAYRFWEIRKSFADLDAEQFAKFKVLLENSISKKNDFISAPLAVNQHLNVFAYIMNMINSEEKYAYFKKATHEIDADEVEKELLELVKIGEFDFRFLDFKEENLIIEALQRSKSFFGNISYLLFSPNFKKLGSLLESFNYYYSAKNLSLVHQKLLHIQSFEKVYHSRKNLLSTDDPELFLAELEICKWALHANKIWPKNINKKLFTDSNPTTEEFGQALRNCYVYCDRIQELDKSLKPYILDNQHNSFWDGIQIDFVDYLIKNWELMQEYDTIQTSFSAAEAQVFALIKEKEDWDTVFFDSLVQSWIQFIEEKHPILKSVSTLKMEHLEQELAEAVAKKKELSTEIVKVKLKEWVYDELEKNRLGNMLTYRDLQHQCSKKRKIWPLRKVLENFKTEIDKLMPCWLVSPETASCLFQYQGEKLFDLVIFDEASQCFPEHGVPSVAKAAQVVVVGDTKQLQPSDLYKIRFEIEEEDVPELDVESLMQLAARYLPTKNLTEHYRSKNPDLMAFSNHHFYENKLKLLPYWKDAHQQSIALINVNGVWENQTNRVEVEKVAELLGEIPPHKTVGIVAFNFKQANLIFSFLESRGLLSENVFVKNIENIQGDEFDVVIFSIAYSANMEGKINMNFGLLNQKGGENRLNVAITRAKEKVIVVTSITSEQLKIENSQNEGPKLLKKYLAFAENVNKPLYKNEFYESEIPKSFQLKTLLLDHSAMKLSTLPYADLVHESENLFWLTDDQVFYDALSPKDFFYYTPEILKTKGWRFERKWSRNYHPKA
jgi:superfamily I DNA and/or RNA helicase